MTIIEQSQQATINSLRATVDGMNKTIEALQSARAICYGTCEDMLDGKPLPGNWNDGTDGACPGWWRGQDSGVDGAIRQLRKVFGRGERVGAFGHEEMNKLAFDIVRLRKFTETIAAVQGDVDKGCPHCPYDQFMHSTKCIVQQARLALPKEEL